MRNSQMRHTIWPFEWGVSEVLRGMKAPLPLAAFMYNPIEAVLYDLVPHGFIIYFS